MNASSDMPVLGNSEIPLYARIRDELQARILNGTWAPGELLPPERELCDRFGVSKGPVRQAIAELAARHLVETRRGKGTLVAPPQKVSVFLEHRGFFAELEEGGLTPSIRLISCEDKPASEKVARALDVGADAPVREIVRVISGDGEPIGLATTYLSEEIGTKISPPELETKSLFEILTSLVPLTRIHEEIGVHLLGVSERRLLSIRGTGATPALMSRRTAFSHASRIEYTELIVANDRCNYSIEYTPRNDGRRGGEDTH